MLAKHRIEKLPLVDEQGHLKGLITVKDIQKKRDYPNAAIDKEAACYVRRLSAWAKMQKHAPGRLLMPAWM